MSWTWLLVIAAGLYAQKALGPLVLAGRDIPVRAEQLLGLVAVPLLGALVVVQTVSDGSELVLDARLPAVAVAAVLVWRRAPFIVTVGAAAGVAALLRALG